MNFSSYSNSPVIPNSQWDHDHKPGTGPWSGWLDNHSKEFNAGVDKLKDELKQAFESLKSNPSDPAALASYQTKLSEYNMYRMLQSNSSKTLADMQKQNIRNVA